MVGWSLGSLMKNRVFFPQTALDVWLVEGTVDLQGDELAILAEERRYRLTESVHVVREVSGSSDAHGLVGRVKAKDALLAKGAELLESSMILGDNAYDVLPGWLGEPIGPFEEYAARRAAEGPADACAPTSDEELLASLLRKSV